MMMNCLTHTQGSIVLAEMKTLAVTVQTNHGRMFVVECPGLQVAHSTQTTVITTNDHKREQPSSECHSKGSPQLSSLFQR